MQTKSLTIDLTKIRGAGEFKCPKCGVHISPDDTTEETYTVLDSVMKKDQLTELVLQCNKCQSQIHLVGFQLLNKIK